MKKLDTIQKREKLNDIYAIGEKGPGGAKHIYFVRSKDTFKNNDREPLFAEYIDFQHGARKEDNSQHGFIDSDLLEIVRDRLIAFQDGPFASEYNAQALKGVEDALHWLNKRIEDRIERNILGENKK